jgi:hypothetical protein
MIDLLYLSFVLDVMALSYIDYSCAMRAPRGILNRLESMQESGVTFYPVFEGAFCPLSREAHGARATYAYSGLEGLGFGGGVAAGAGQTQK